MRIVRRSFVLSSLLLVVLAMAPSPARGALGGADLNALALGARWTFDQPGSPIPAKPTGEMTQAYSAADYKSGPTTHGLASVLWPGSAGANAGPVFGFPAYPVRAEAFSPGEPHKSNNDYGPHTTMAAKATPTASSAETHSQDSSEGAPGFVTGNFDTTAGTAISGDQAVSEATAVAQDVSLGEGQIHIGSVVSEAKAITDGRNGKVSGETTVSGVTIAGQAVTVDEHGVHIGGQDVPVLDPIADKQVQEALDQAGITMKVARPVDQGKGAEASRTLGGLVIEFEPGALNSVVDQLPPEIKDQLKKYISFNQSITYQLGAVSVSSDTISGFDFPVPPPPPGGGPPPAPGSGGGTVGGVSGGSAFGGAGGGGTGTSPLPPASTGTGTTGTVSASLPLNVPPGRAVPAILAAFALLAAVASSRILKEIADKAVAARAADRCPLEER